MGEPEAKRARTAAVVEPAGLKCPITLELLRDPVCNSVGNTYERDAIVAHLAKPGPLRDPLTNEALANTTLVPNQSLRRLVQDFLDAHPDYTPEGWENRMVPPLPGAVQAALAEVAAARAANSVPRLLAAQARESEVYGLVLAAMRNYRSHVKLQTEACCLLPQLFSCTKVPDYGLGKSGLALVERVLAAATAHEADAGCAVAVCTALAFMLEHGEWARAAVEQGGVKAVLALLSAHSAVEHLRSAGIAALSSMVRHADWASVSSEAGKILTEAVQGLSAAASVMGSFRQGNCVLALVLLVFKDELLAAQIIASGTFDLTIKAMRANLGNEWLQRSCCSLLHHLAASPNISAVPRLQLYGAQEAVVAAMESHSGSAAVQKFGIAALEVLQPLIRRHLCAAVEAGRAAHRGLLAARSPRPPLPALQTLRRRPLRLRALRLRLTPRRLGSCATKRSPAEDEFICDDDHRGVQSGVLSLGI